MYFDDPSTPAGQIESEEGWSELIFKENICSQSQFDRMMRDEIFGSPMKSMEQDYTAAMLAEFDRCRAAYKISKTA